MNHRVLIFATTYFPLVGGAEVALKELTDRLPQWEFDLVCARIQPNLPSVERIGRVTVHRCGIGHPLDKYALWLWGTIRAFRVFSRERAPVFVWSLMASYGGFAALVYTWLRPKTALLLTLQEGDPLDHYAKRVGWLMWVHRAIFRRANAVQAISGFLAEWAIRMGFTGKPNVIPNGVDVEKFTQTFSASRRIEVRNTLGFIPEDRLLITTSRLSLKNGVDDLIRALTFLPVAYKALIVGEGEDRQKLESLVTELDLESRVKFVGKRTHDELPALLNASDVFVRPSLSEGLGNSFLEAMASGIPIIGTPVGGIPDFLQDGVTGIFCRVRDPESIARAVERVQSDDAFREKMIQRARILVEDGYQWKTIARNMDTLMNRLGHSDIF